MTEDLQLLAADKDTSTSCVFEFPDRPVDSLPPEYPPGTPPEQYPYNPVDDWPYIPPSERPTPGSDPHPNDIIPPLNPTEATLILLYPYYYLDEDAMPAYGGGVGNLHGGSNATPNLGLICHILNSFRMAPKTEVGPLLLSETGFSNDAAAPSNTIENDSGLFIYSVERPGTARLTYLAYYARYYNPVTGDHYLSLGPVSVTPVGVDPTVTVVNNASFKVVPEFLPINGHTAARTTVTKVFPTAAFFLTDETVISPLELNVG
jgi:hypothetical protein